MKEQEFSVRVLAMRRSGGYAMVSIDMDIWGYGESREEAMSNLLDHLRIHLKYLRGADKLQLIDSPCEREYLAMFQECVLARVKNEVIPDWWVLTLMSDKLLDPHGDDDITKIATSPTARYYAKRCKQLAS